jgi:hypothetical protein
MIFRYWVRYCSCLKRGGFTLIISLQSSKRKAIESGEEDTALASAKRLRVAAGGGGGDGGDGGDGAVDPNPGRVNWVCPVRGAESIDRNSVVSASHGVQPNLRADTLVPGPGDDLDESDLDDLAPSQALSDSMSPPSDEEHGSLQRADLSQREWEISLQPASLTNKQYTFISGLVRSFAMPERANWQHHEFYRWVDPFVEAWNAASGLVEEATEADELCNAVRSCQATEDNITLCGFKSMTPASSCHEPVRSVESSIRSFRI